MPANGLQRITELELLSVKQAILTQYQITSPKQITIDCLSNAVTTAIRNEHD